MIALTLLPVIILNRMHHAVILGLMHIGLVLGCCFLIGARSSILIVREDASVSNRILDGGAVVVDAEVVVPEVEESATEVEVGTFFVIGLGRGLKAILELN
jgi:hypothetical protein